MGAFICKQPNGKYCRFSTVVDTITDWNMTEEDYIEMCKQKAEEEAKDVLKNHLKQFDMVKSYFYPTNMKEKQFKDILKAMGDSDADNFYKTKLSKKWK